MREKHKTGGQCYQIYVHNLQNKGQNCIVKNDLIFLLIHRAMEKNDIYQTALKLSTKF